MVAVKDIKLNNESIKTPSSNPVAVFVGGTGGIGRSALQALLKYTSSPTVYLVGRDPSRLEKQISELKTLNTSATIIPIIANDLTLVREAQKAADEIASKASRVDYLIMSAGFLNFNSAPDYTAEGLDKITAIRYHARMAFLVKLLPLLRQSSAPRVISVLAGGGEGALDLNDLGMTSAKNYSFVAAGGQAASMTTLFFEQTSKQPENKNIVFIHIFPGIVKTQLRIEAGWIATLLYTWILQYFLMNIIGYSSEEAGERVLFAATNDRFAKAQPDIGVYLVGGNSDSAAVNKDLKKLREQGAEAKVYEYTMSDLERIEKSY
ncbi:hypothetical protein EDD37DRAFT_635466 [Exophiala viscosa]|uniref:uncharacterized protein n=1 Tax=Exophiala viscosa TaxID=2486360 RepID=UPI0021900569|nr:hypothetical protein EDD37DRAFT_635466 [Exophiala viscosa]